MAMAEVELVCSTCGKTFTHRKKRYNRADADQYEEWARAHIDTCPDCFRAQQQKEKELEAAARSSQLPQLQGSEKQVAWANTIRDKMISENQLAQGIRDGEFINPDGTTLTFQQAQEFWATADSTPEQKSAADAIIKLFTETQAKWFIDHRFDRI